MIILLVLLLRHFGHAHAEKAEKNEFAGNPVEVTAEMQTVITEDSYLELCYDSFAEASSETSVEASSETSTWELRKHEDEVYIYQRWVEAEPGRKARELYAELVVAAKPEELSQIIRDEKYGTKWLSMADEYKVLKQSSEQEWYAYSRFDFLPALQFDLVTRNEMKVNATTQAITIGIYGVPNYLPEEEKYRRLSHFDGQWEFTPTDNNHTRIRYYLFSKTKPFLPRWITDPFVFGELKNCVVNVKQLAENS